MLVSMKCIIVLQRLTWRASSVTNSVMQVSLICKQYFNWFLSFSTLIEFCFISRLTSKFYQHNTSVLWPMNFTILLSVKLSNSEVDDCIDEWPLRTEGCKSYHCAQCCVFALVWNLWGQVRGSLFQPCTESDQYLQLDQGRFAWSD